ncbi:hypothetical protein HRG_006316 [Hirsutella rhossiliensis]|uniref:Uncharacterized protein n=1 Tax=Hirsutella rhossiliensis TaxID=111463 RepID=A0A9P8MW06_9HYPO|nr:uncharacterized protein HRG_06316 [Hirsutella rhossiliensis]KAH0962214.1 hypothetical protein HRG_06316 [Hirsutella rhossiliensis]
MRRWFEAERIICYDIRRRLNTPMAAEQKTSNDFALPTPAVTAIHIDQTREGGFHRIKRHLTEDEQKTYLSGGYRARIMNVWRPLFRKISDAPLVFCDARTLVEDDLVPADRVSPEYVGEVYYVRPSARQRWYWLSDMSPDEIAIFPWKAIIKEPAPKQASAAEDVEIRLAGERDKQNGYGG